MKTKELIEISKLVKRLLESDKYTRIDDNYLIMRVIQIRHPNEAGKVFTDVMFNARKNGINFESIRRCRQRIQQKHPELKDIETAEARFEEQSEYQRFAING